MNNKGYEIFVDIFLHLGEVSMNNRKTFLNPLNSTMD